jgi:hypothetical protein
MRSNVSFVVRSCSAKRTNGRLTQRLKPARNDTRQERVGEEPAWQRAALGIAPKSGIDKFFPDEQYPLRPRVRNRVWASSGIARVSFPPLEASLAESLRLRRLEAFVQRRESAVSTVALTEHAVFVSPSCAIIEHLKYSSGKNALSTASWFFPYSGHWSYSLKPIDISLCRRL